MSEPLPPLRGSLILPVHDAAPYIDKTLRDVDAWLATRRRTWEVLLVDDASRDRTPEILEEWVARHPRETARVIRLTSNRGKGFAVRTGLLRARAPIAVFTDCDLAYPLHNVDRVLATLDAGADAVIACRVLPESVYRMSPSFFSYLYTRHAAGRIFNAVCRLLTVPGILDTQAGLKGFRTGVVRKILGHLVMDGFSFDVELLRALLDRGARVVEVPVEFRYDSEPTTVQFLEDTLRMVRDLVRIRARSLAHRYKAAASPPAPSRLIVQADDYGLAPGVNRAIEEGLRAGALTSASLMLGNAHSDEALAWAGRHPEYDFGVHLNLTRGSPVLPAGEVPSLVGTSGRFLSLRGLLARAVEGRLRYAEVRAEWDAQIATVTGAGVAISHLNSHEHVHLVPRTLARTAREIARERKLPLRAMDGPFRGVGIRGTIKGAALAVSTRLALGRAGRESGAPQGFGTAIAARPTLDVVQRAVARMRPGATYEFVVHPGTVDRDLVETGDTYLEGREAECSLLASEEFRAVLAFAGVELINWRGVKSRPL